MIKIETIMKANFNIAKNVRNSRSINALCALRKLQSLGLLLCALLLGGSQVWGADELYQTITFLDNGTATDGSSSFNSSTPITDKISPSDCATLTTTTSYTYQAQEGYGWKLSSSGSNGTVTMNLKEKIKNVTRIVINASRYHSTKGTNLNCNGLGAQALSYDWGDLEYNYATATDITQIVLAASPATSGDRRCYVRTLKIYCETAGPTLYTVTFDANGGSVTPASATQASAGAAIALPTPTWSGYNCTGWFTATSGGTKRGDAGGSYTPTASETIHAQWSAKTYSNYRTLCSTTDPSLSVSPASLNELDYIVGAGPSDAKSFSMSGSNLESGTLTVTAPTNFQVSKASGSGWASSITFTDVSGTLAATTVYVRLATGKSAGEYSGNVSISGCGLESAVQVAVSGTVYTPTIIATPASVSWSTAVGVLPTTQSVTITGTHLKGAISATLNGTDAGSFSISTTSIAKATAEGAGGTITITYTGSTAATTTKTANIQLTASDATTVNVPITFNVIVDPNRYVLTPFGEIGPKDKVIIVGDNGTKYAMSNNNGTTNPPSAIDVTDYIIEAGAALSIADASTMLWNIVKAGDGSFKIKKQSDNTVWLYCTSSNNGVRVGTSAENDFVIVNDGDADGYIRNTYRDALIGVYQSTDWRRYEYGVGHTIGTNIAGQTFSFYVQKSTDPFVTLTSSFSEFTYEHNHGPSVSQSFTVSGTNLQGNITITPPSNYAISTDNSSFSTSPINLSPTDGTVASTTLYIQLVAGLAVGTYNVEQASGLSVTSTNADAVKVAVSGSVTPESFTVTATSSNVSHGTVSPASQSTTTNMTITASPVDGYRVVSGAGGYSVTAGTASVTNNGDNTFTVTPSTDCTVRINFEAIPTHKVTYWATGTKIQETDVREGAAIPDQTTETASGIEAYCGNRDHFVGWTTNSSYSHATDAPAGMITSMSPGGTMSTSDVNYYAVFANTGGVGSTSFSRVTSLSQLADGDVIAIVAEQSGGQIFGTSADHKGGGAPEETAGKITVSASTNQWTLEASSSDWKLHKGDNNADILCADLTYTAYGNAMSIVDAKTSNYFFIKSSSKALEYFGNTWQFYTISNPATDAQNGNVRLKIYKQDAGFVDYTTQCCSLQPVTDVVVNSMTNTSVTLGWTLPASTAGITKFQVIDVDNGNAVVKDNISTSATNSGSISGLTKCNTYRYKVVSYSSTCTVTSSAIEFRPFGDARTVNFNYNGGTGTPASFTTSCDGTSTTLPTPDARDGYTFLGWWSASSGGDKRGDAGDSYTVTGNTTIWAHWAQNFTVTYNRKGGTIVCGGSEIGVAGQTFTICTTEPTRSGYIFAGWDTEEGGTGTRYNAGGTFTMPSSDVTLYAQWTDNWRNLTFNVPAGGGSASGVPSGNHVRDGQSFTMPTITGKSDSKWCWTFLGWTETAPNGSGRWDVTPSYIAGGATSGAITSDKVYYAVYSKTGAGASGTVELTSSDISRLYTENVSGTENIPYGTSHSVTATDGSVWTTTGQQTNGNKTIIQVTNASGVWIQLPVVGGEYNSITISHNSNSSARSIAYRTAAAGSDVASATTAASSSGPTTITISSGGTTGGYIVNTSGYQYQISGITASYGPPAVYGYTLDDCPCVVEEFDLTYDANATTFPGSTTTCTGVTDYRWEDHDNEYTICSTEPTLEGYKFTHWATNANGSGTTYDAGEVITCVGETPITLYARYERVYTVTFNNQGVTTPVTQASEGATIAVPSATSPCSAEWAFVGWSETAIAPMSMLPTLEITAGTSTYTPTADKTLYAIYRKTSESSPFVAGMSGAYKIKATKSATDYYATTAGAKLDKSTNSAEAVTYYIKYSSADGGKYTIQRNDGKYIAYKGKPASVGAHTDLQVSDDVFYWRISSAGGGLWAVQSPTSTDANTRYLQLDNEANPPTGFKAYHNGINIAFVATEGQYYYRTMTCASEYDITFHANGTTINWAGGYPEASYKNLADATVVSTFPTATFDGWTFLGWRRSDYAESTTAPISSTIFGGSDGTSGNNLTIASANEDLYPVFTRFEDNEPFDQINGGDYFIYFLEEGSDDGYGGEKRVYAGEYNGAKRYFSTALCENAKEFTFTKLANGNWTIKDKATGNYLYGIDGDDDLKQRASATNSEWTLTINGNQFDAYHVGTTYGQLQALGNGTSATFMNYRRTNVGTGDYHRVYLGSCTNRTFTTNPSITPNIEIHGEVKVTSTATKSVKARTALTVSASNISTANLTVTSDNSAFKFSLTSNGTYTASVNIPVVSNKVGVTPVYIEYTPTATSDGVEGAIVTVSDGAGTPTSVSTTAGDVQGRHVPAEFVIAAKWGDKWYALPANCTSATSSTTGALIEVDNASDPTTATYAPTYTKWGLQTVRPGRIADYGTRLVFTEQLTTATADNQKTLYNGSTTSIQANAQYGNYAVTNPERYEWIPTSTDLKDYVLTSATTLGGDANPRTVSLSNKGVFGTLLNNKAYEGKVRLLPATFIEPAEIQVVEWKASSVVVMYTGSGTKAITQLGDDDPSSAQSLSSAKIDHGVFELTTSTLTSAKNEPLNITIQNGSDAMVGRKSLVVPAIVNGSQVAPLGLEADEATLTDVVVLDGATLSAVATKYTFKNITVYPGGKLVIGADKQLGMASLTLRGGSSWGAASYEYKYPQFVVNNTSSGAYSNSSGVINYDYVTTKAQYYTFVLPYNGSTSTIKYPVDIYGSAVSASNTGSFEFQYYDGAARAGGGTGWAVLAEPATLVAGTGYTFLGMPKKVDAYDGTDDSHSSLRQTYGIHRIPMSVAAATVQAGETGGGEPENKPISINVILASKNNDSGWNLVGNPYMANVSGLSNTDIQVGQLVHTSTVPWDGKWQWDDTNPTTGVRYIVTTDDGQNFESQQASTATLKAFKNFFVQIQNAEATSLVIPANTRTDKNLAPARYIADVEKDIQLAVDLVSETRSDKVDLLINDIYTAEFDQDGDFTKMMNTTNFNLYGVYPEDYLSFIAVDKTTAAGSVAIGYQVPEGGEYTLQLSDRAYVMADAVEALYVTDHEMSPEVTTNLLDGAYEFHVNNAETNNTRFTVSIQLKDEEQTPTDIDDVREDSDKPTKFIYHDKMYILRGGKIYDSTGKMVKEINK